MVIPALGRKPFVCKNPLPDGTPCQSTEFIVGQLTDLHYEVIGGQAKVGGTSKGSGFTCTRCRKIWTPETTMESIRLELAKDLLGDSNES